MIASKIQALLAFGALVAASAIPAAQKAIEEDDTPLPLIIWHGPFNPTDSVPVINSDDYG